MGIKDYFKKAKEDLISKYLWKAIRAEFLGSILYTLLGCSYSINLKNDNNDYEVMVCVLSFGITLTVLVKILGPISGGYFNPAVTVAFMCARYIPILKGICYIIIQLLGSVCGAAILYGLIPDAMHSEDSVPKVNNTIDNVRAFGYEFLSTFMLAFSYFSTLEHKNNVLQADHVTCGLSLCLSQLFAFRMTGAAVNPARAFGPALIHNSWKNHWIYWVGPLLGGIFGGFTHEYTNKKKETLRNFQSALHQHVYSLEQKEDGASCNSLTTDVACDHEQTEELQM